MQSVIDFVWNNGAYFLAAAWAICEVLNQIPSIRANTVFTFIFGWLKQKEGK